MSEGESELCRSCLFVSIHPLPTVNSQSDTPLQYVYPRLVCVRPPTTENAKSTRQHAAGRVDDP